MLIFERELAQVKKEHRAEVLEIKQNMMDADAVSKNLRHQIEQSSAAHEFKKQELVATNSDTLPGMQMRIDQIDRVIRKLNTDVENQSAQTRDSNRQFQM